MSCDVMPGSPIVMNMHVFLLQALANPLNRGSLSSVRCKATSAEAAGETASAAAASSKGGFNFGMYHKQLS